MYDFSIQKEMLRAALQLLEEKDLLTHAALGGGTALSAYYWGHRYSTDIDMFIHSKENIAKALRQNQWSSDFLKRIQALGYTNGYKSNPIYTEIAIDNACKIQYFSVVDRTKEPYTKMKLWDMDVAIESIEEIIAKKIYFRASVGNARDLFDIALAVHKKPHILNEINLPFKSIETLFETVTSIKNDADLREEYGNEIDQMNPHGNYKFIAEYTVPYLHLFLESYCAAHHTGIVLEDEDCKEIEMYAYEALGDTNA
ncbi:nucleotidyl transferase AbiEii/AbiGii toxin family protein [Sulfurovum riftiae]|uniref:Nucleotidyltransferase n=1 Tax=Sulfurovum riftiae TaxID=1630136 RepID=A0A151CDJ1_9BACT|nr:nucleotidyl transferase AbiEii/AbiGii toxin family protein [Sulfurovum riftiae]KYJ85575.1 hypothetical protein AS592_00590 [Sulfurovum riftiae]